ncbi:hypothetical protein [Sphingomicrobium lutaoense]|nr:hypothetical protein [Sphingomicrobium lutaoense]
MMVLIGLALSSTVHAIPSSIDPGERYVELALALDSATDGGYIFRYDGPKELRDRAESSNLSVDEIASQARGLLAYLNERQATGVEQERQEALRASLLAMLGRIRVLNGDKLSFTDEAEQIFGVRPPRYDANEADAAIASIEALLPGEGSLASRMEAFEARMKIPSGRLSAVVQAAVDECRRRTALHIPLPDDALEVRLVDQLPAIGRYDYLGNYRGRVTINREMVDASNLLYIACHEGYPGHHLRSVLLEHQYGKYDWPEHDLKTLYGPSAIVSEGLGQYAVELAFPESEMENYLRENLLPMAGIDPSEARRIIALRRAWKTLSPYATVEISRAYLDGEIDREQAVDLLSRYTLKSRETTSQMFGFVDAFRTYVVTYTFGEEFVRNAIEAAVANGSSKWEAFARLATAQVTPALMQNSEAGKE